MAKFELTIYDNKTGEKARTEQRAFMPVDLYIRFQAFAEKTTTDKFKTDKEFFDELKPLCLELFPNMTEEEYKNQTDIAEVLVLFSKVIDKSTDIGDEDSDNSKNG